MSTVSAAASIAWQLNRLVATETSQLIPGYQTNVLQQALTIALAVIGFQVLACVIFSAYEVIAHLWLAVAVGLGFVWLCLWRSHYFHLSFALFIAVPFLDELASRLSQWVQLNHCCHAVLSGGWLMSATALEQRCAGGVPQCRTNGLDVVTEH
ncbi:hypothetical protein [Shewanella phaeophyticola]|uniref:Uncharacterized protein n=1 Tax=Shewanella phaeophyticola TaxID=2978345 RepID=A0ABT2P9L6_9GAMM|nr:hypothetical protein [Shewanella sp. KJ10-1]MCT8988360.1 hypothetical protein [Shewanella sp. KJ10-1]